MSTLTLPRWFGRTRSAASRAGAGRRGAKLRIGIPRVLNLWSTHQFWMGFFTELGVDPRHLVFSSDTSEEQGAAVRQGPRDGGLLLSGEVHRRPLRRAGLRPAREARRAVLADDLQPAVVPLGPRGAHADLPAGDGRAGEHQGRLHEGARRLRRAGHPLRGALRLARRAQARAQAALRGTARRDPRAHRRGDGGGRSQAGYRALDDFNARLRSKSREVLRVVRAREPGVPDGAGPAVSHGSRGSATRSRWISRPTATRCSGPSTSRSTET